MPDYSHNMLLNVAMISGRFEGNPKYNAFYARHAEELGGAPGIADLLVKAAQAFTDEERDHDWGRPEYWVKATTEFAAVLLELLVIPTSIQLQKLAEAFFKSSVE